MKMGLPLYHVERTVQESGALFGDGAHIVYVNGSYKSDSDPIGKLMHDFRCTSAADMFYQEFAKNLMEALKVTAEQAMAILKISDADKAVLSKRF